MIYISESSTEWWWFESNAKVWLFAERTCRDLRSESIWIRRLTSILGRRFLMLWKMRVWTFDLYEAFRADVLVATSSFVQVRRVVQKAYRTL